MTIDARRTMLTPQGPGSAKAANTETWRETLPRYAGGGGSDLAIQASGICTASAIYLYAGDIVTNITFVTGGTAASGPTAGFVALYSSAATPALLSQSADFTTTARAANTKYVVALGAAQTITAAGWYYISISFTVSTTMPTLRGANLGGVGLMSGALVSGMPLLEISHGSAVGGTAPATITGGSQNTGAYPYFATS